MLGYLIIVVKATNTFKIFIGNIIFKSLCTVVDYEVFTPVTTNISVISKNSFHWLNHIWTGLFANLKRLWAKMPPPPTYLAISSQMTMKLGKDILWIEVFTH